MAMTMGLVSSYQQWRPLIPQLFLLFLLSPKIIIPFALGHQDEETCSSSNDIAASPLASYNKEIPGPEYFSKLQQAYCISKENSTDPHDVKIIQKLCHTDIDMDESSGYSSSRYYTGALIPIEIKYAGSLGRGIFVKEPVAKGTPVWRLENYGIFYDKDEWYSFLDELPYDEYAVALDEWAYVMEWEYYYDEEEDEEEILYVVGLDLDESSIINHGTSSDKSTDTEDAAAIFGNLPPINATVHASNNIKVVPVDGKPESFQYIAEKDIQAGEEIRCDYTKFHERTHNLDWFDIKKYNTYLRVKKEGEPQAEGVKVE